jgi:capsular polysaccharide biosynthesis protein
VSMLRWGLRRYRFLFVICVLLGLLAAPAVALLRPTPYEAEALVVAQRLDMNLNALPRYGQAVFNNGAVAQAVTREFFSDNDPGTVVPDRVRLVTEQDNIILAVVGQDPNPRQAADLANAAAQAFLDALNAPGSGVGTFILQSPATPPAGNDKGLNVLVAVPIGLGAGLILGLAAVSALLVARRPVVSSVDAEELTGISALGTVTVPRSLRGQIVAPQYIAGLAPVCRRLLALPTPTLLLVSQPRHAPMRRQLSTALTVVLRRVRDVRFLGPDSLQDAVAGHAASDRWSDQDYVGDQTPMTVVDSNEALDLIQPPESTTTILVVPEGIGSAALHSAVVEHLGGSAESRLIMARYGRRLPRRVTRGEKGPTTDSGQLVAPTDRVDDRPGSEVRAGSEAHAGTTAAEDPAGRAP